MPALSATELDNEEILALRPTDRERVLAELAALGTILVPCLVDVSAPCPNERCQDGHVDLLDGTRVPCHRCEGTGAVDGRPVCHVDGCLDHGRPLRPSLTGWECARVHGHGAPPAPGHLEEPALPRQIMKAAVDTVVTATASPIASPVPFLDDLNEKLKGLSINAHAEMVGPRVVITMSGNATIADVEAMAILLRHHWPSERPPVTGRVETGAGR